MKVVEAASTKAQVWGPSQIVTLGDLSDSKDFLVTW